MWNSGKKNLLHVYAKVTQCLTSIASVQDNLPGTHNTIQYYFIDSV